MRGVGAARTRITRLLALFGLCSVALLQNAFARQFELDFDGPEPTWQVRCRQNEAVLEAQVRRREQARRGQCEFIRVQAAVDNTPMRLEHEVPAVRVLDELTASVWYRSDRPGATLAIRIAFYGSADPATGAPLSLVVMGDKYEDVGKWQQLTCRTADKAVNDQLRQLRAKRRAVLDPATMYVDRIVIGAQLGKGTTELQIDDFELGPVVPVDYEVGGNGAIEKISAVEPEMRLGSASTKSPTVPVEFRMHKLRVNSKPFFPRIIQHRQERPELIADAGYNAIWVSDVESMANTGQFRDRGIWLTTTPPFAKDADGAPLDSDDASLLPFAPNTTSILFWMMGVRMTAETKPRMTSWANQVRDADRSFKRPLAADVADDERIASRHLDIVGLSRHVLNSGVSLADFRDEIIRRRDRAWPGTFCFSWIQTEPASELMDLKQIADEIPVLEPEQLRLQVYAALAAGCRGIGYWTTSALDSDGPGARERHLMLTQLNLELGLLEPWLATGSATQLIPFTVEAPTKPGKSAAKPIKGSEADRRHERELSAAMIRTEFGLLVLPMWLEDNSQFVPGQLASSSATIVVPGGGQTATAWQISTTGRVQNLNRETIAGGIRIVIPKFDQTAAILVTSDPSIVDEINQRIALTEERSATVMLELARLKLERVRKIDQQLQQLGVGQPDSRQLLGQAKLQYEMAEARLKQQEYHTARQYAGTVMQLTRILQRTHWDHAVAKQVSPVTSPFTLCFQTLPAHWRLIRAMEKAGKSNDVNRLPSGDFEDLDTVIAGGWRNEQTPVADVKTIADLHPVAKKGRFSLRLSAESTIPDPATFQFAFAPLAITSPPLSVNAGQLVKISGWVKTPQSIVRSLDGALIYDSLMGKTGGIRITNANEWQRFEIWRVVPSSQQLTVTAEMHGLGEFLLDELKITSSPLANDLAASPRVVDPEVKPSRFAPLDLRRLVPGRK